MKSVPLNRMASSQNFFNWFCGVLICQWGLIPRRTKSCEVSDPAEQEPAGYQTPQNKSLLGIRPRWTKSCGVPDPAEPWQRCVYFKADACSAGSDTPQNNILWRLILRLTKFCRVSDPAVQSSAGFQTPGNNFKYKYFHEFETEFKNILGCEFGDYSIWDKHEICGL